MTVTCMIRHVELLKRLDRIIELLSYALAGLNEERR